MKYNYKTEPFQHQRNALNAGGLHIDYAYFMEMGTGKTKVAIDNAAFMKKNMWIDWVIVVAPNSVYRNWIDEIQKHSDSNVIHVHKDKSIYGDMIRHPERALKWFLINVEALSHKSGVEKLKSLLTRKNCRHLMILDESTTIKNRSAKRTRNICKLGKLANYRRILTGSPITKSPLDLYTQCEFLSPQLLGFDSFFTFRARYAVMQQIEMGGKQMLFPKYYTNLDELTDKLKNFSFRVRKKDCLDLPDKLYTVRKINLTVKQAEIYNRLKKFAYATINQDEVSFANKLTEILRLHQVTNGFVKSDDGTIQVFDDCPKLKELMEILEDTEGKFIIWANYVQNIKTIINKLKEKYGADSVVSIFGEVSTEDRQQAVSKFQNDNSCRFFVGNPSTGGYGLTLTSASYVVYFSNSYNLEVREQSEDRAHRIGQDKNVTYIDLIAENTIDEFIVSALDKKLKLSAETLGEEVKKWLK
jgi:SNF2 family DNA or RNA helicase